MGDTLYLRGIRPRGLKDQFSAACRRRGRTMMAVLTEFMKDFAKHAEKLRIRTFTRGRGG